MKEKESHALLFFHAVYRGTEALRLFLFYQLHHKTFFGKGHGACGQQPRIRAGSFALCGQADGAAGVVFIHAFH